MLKQKSLVASSPIHDQVAQQSLVGDINIWQKKSVLKIFA